MPKLIEITPVKTYISKKTAIEAVERKFGILAEFDQVRYFVMESPESGRFFPVFVGVNAATLGIHFHFNVIA